MTLTRCIHISQHTHKVLEAVACLHDNWIQHRDLKLSNLLMDSRGNIRVCVCPGGVVSICGVHDALHVHPVHSAGHACVCLYEATLFV